MKKALIIIGLYAVFDVRLYLLFYNKAEWVIVLLSIIFFNIFVLFPICLMDLFFNPHKEYCFNVEKIIIAMKASKKSRKEKDLKV